MSLELECYEIGSTRTWGILLGNIQVIYFWRNQATLVHTHMHLYWEEYHRFISSTVVGWRHIYHVEKRNQLDVTLWFIVLMNCCQCLGHSYAHHQELETILVLICGAWCQRCWWSASRCRAAGYVILRAVYKNNKSSSDIWMVSLLHIYRRCTDTRISNAHISSYITVSCCIVA
jgi:hypothetical protein